MILLMFINLNELSSSRVSVITYAQVLSVIQDYHTKLQRNGSNKKKTKTNRKELVFLGLQMMRAAQVFSKPHKILLRTILINLAIV